MAVFFHGYRTAANSRAPQEKIQIPLNIISYVLVVHLY